MAGCGGGQADAGHEAGAGVRLALLGRFNEPTYLTAPPGDTRRRFVVERGGRIRVVLRGRKLRRPFLSIPGRVQTGGESGMLSMAFAPDYARSRRYYVYFTETRASSRSSNTGARPAAPTARSPARAARDPHPAPRVQPQGRTGGLRARWFPLPRPGRRRRGRRPRPQRPESRQPARQDPPRHGPTRTGLLDSPVNPFVGRAGARGEVFAYGLRNPYRFSFDRAPARYGRRRRPGRRGGSELRAPAEQRWLQLRLEPLRGPPALQLRRHPESPPAVRRAQPEPGVVLDHRGLRGARPSLPALRGKYIFGDYCAPALRVASVRGSRPAAVVRSGCACQSWSRSARTRAGTSTRSRWTGRCIDCAARVPRP